MDEVIDALVPGGWGLAIGVGVGVALIMGRGFRPLAKQAIKGYLAASEGVQRATAGAREGLQDLYQEAKSERQGEVQAQPSESGAQP
jgi:hypothetical protein